MMRTPEIISQHKQILLLHQTERKGKVAAMNRAIKYVETPYVIFSDANTLLNERAVREIVKHYADPRVGGVAGEKKIISKETDKAAGAGEGIYWKYESLLEKTGFRILFRCGCGRRVVFSKNLIFFMKRQRIQ